MFLQRIDEILKSMKLNFHFHLHKTRQYVIPKNPVSLPLYISYEVI